MIQGNSCNNSTQQLTERTHFSRRPSCYCKNIFLFTVSAFRLEERADDGSRNEGTLEMIAERQKELRLALLGMEAQVERSNVQALYKFPKVERLLEEGRETQGALTRQILIKT